MAPDIRWDLPVYFSKSRDAAENLAMEDICFIPSRKTGKFSIFVKTIRR